jgi:hypothetical protein
MITDEQLAEWERQVATYLDYRCEETLPREAIAAVPELIAEVRRLRADDGMDHYAQAAEG